MSVSTELEVIVASPVASATKVVVLATRLSAVDASFVLGAVQERGISTAQFLAEAAIEYAMRPGLWSDKPESTGLSAEDTCAT